MGPVWERGHLPIACDGYVPLREVGFSRLNFMKVGIFFMKVGLNFMKWCLTELFSRNLCLQVAKDYNIEYNKREKQYILSLKHVTK